METLQKVIFEYELKNPIPADGFNIKDYISYEHYQDCCERCYIDFEHVDMYDNWIKQLEEITKIKIIGVKDEGIVVYLYGKKGRGEENRIGISLAARNSQNGYYNDEVILVVNVEGITYKENLQDGEFVVNDLG